MTKPIPSAKMLLRLTVAVLVSLAPLEVRAAEPDSAALARKASRLAAKAVAAEDPEAAAIGAFEAHNLWNLAFKADGDERHLCEARSLLVTVCARPDLDDEFRAPLEVSRDALPRCPKPARSQKQIKKRNGSSAKLPEFLDLPEPSAKTEPSAQNEPEVEPPRPQAESPELEQVNPPEGPVQAKSLVSPLPAETLQPQTSSRALRVGGAVSMALGLLALGGMTPFAVRDAAYAAEYSSLVAKSEAAGGLTREEDRRVAELDQSSRLTFRSSLALGVSGGLATVLGASLLIAGQRRSVTLSPSVDRDSASVSLQGRF